VSLDRTARLWDIRTAGSIRLFEGPRPLSNLIFTPDGRFAIVSGIFFTLKLDMRDNIQIWEISEGKKVKDFRITKFAQSEHISSILISHSGAFINIATDHGRIFVFNALKLCSTNSTDADCFVTSLKTKRFPIVDLHLLSSNTIGAIAVNQLT
jgi:WD40 repeat protein